MLSAQFFACAASFLISANPRISRAEDECLAWRERVPNVPPPLYGHAMAFDSHRGVTVLYGGYDEQGPDPTETWEWDGITWTMKNATGPGPRSGHAMAFDSARGVTVLFGGSWGPSSFETWEWDGTTWTLRSTTGPHPRSDHAMVYDSARGVAVLFGGAYYDPDAYPNGDDVYLNDTWEWNGSEWTERLVASPPARAKHAMVFDSSRQRTVLFGGCHGDCRSAELFGDTWEWDGMAWSQASSEGPSPRRDHAMTYDNARHVTLLFSGSGEGSANVGETWQWDGELWTQLSTTNGPTTRRQSAIAFDSVRSVAVLFGGYAGYPAVAWTIPNGETWEWNGVDWSCPEPGTPGQREGHAMAFDSQRGVMVLFGGRLSSLERTGTWEWNGATWRLASRNPDLTRSYHAMAYDSIRGVTVMCGGSGHGADGTWEWDGSRWVSRNARAPDDGNAMVYDRTRGETVLFTSRNETWSWDGTTWTLRATDGPGVRGGAAMAYDAARAVCVLFGGAWWDPVQHTVYLGDTWEWDGTSWALRATDGPAPRDGHTMSYDDARGVTVLFGGMSIGSEMNDTWEWDGTSWTKQNFIGPRARHDTASAYDSVRHVVVLFGGNNDYSYLYGRFADTWEYAPDRIVDGDADGVADSCDLCRATTTGTATDATGCSPVDADLDGDIDLVDFAEFLGCFGAQEPTDSCARFNVFEDYRISRLDFAGFDRVMRGPHLP